MAESLAALRIFPDPNHVANVCRQGTSAQCKFLMEKGTGFSCGMFTKGSVAIAARKSQPPNCGGIVERLNDLKGLLVGQEIKHDDPPYLKRKGRLLRFDLRGTLIVFIADWDSDYQLIPKYANPMIEITEEGITFRPRGWDVELVRTTIVLPPLEDPEPVEEYLVEAPTGQMNPFESAF